MINGILPIKRVREESYCRASQEYRFNDIGIYKIHSTSLMPFIPFETAKKQNENIDTTIFLNDDENKLTLNKQTETQNYLETRYVGRAPLQQYSKSQKTPEGEKFILKCLEGNPNSDYRVFGTEDSIRGYNRSASDNKILPGGGEHTS